MLKRPRVQTPITDQLLTRMNIGQRYWGVDLATVPITASHHRVIHKYINTLPEMADRGIGLLMWGANGVGKTYAAVGVLLAAAKAGFSTYCILSDQLKAIYIDRPMFDPTASVVERVETVDFLLLEDLGKEYSGKDFGWAELCFENMLRKRSRELRPTIITTNLDLQQFVARYQTSAASMAQESMLAIQVKDADYRRAAATKIKQEFGG